MIVFRWILGLVLCLAGLAFAVVNPHDVEILWSPVHDSLVLPVAVLCLLAFAGGFLVGAVMVWIETGPFSSARRAQRRTLKSLRKTLRSCTPDPEVEKSL